MGKEKKQKIVLPESNDERILRAAEILKTRGVTDIVLLGNRDTVLDNAALLEVNLDGVEIIDHTHSSFLDNFIQRFFELRQKKVSPLMLQGMPCLMQTILEL